MQQVIKYEAENICYSYSALEETCTLDTRFKRIKKIKLQVLNEKGDRAVSKRKRKIWQSYAKNWPYQELIIPFNTA